LNPRYRELWEDPDVVNRIDRGIDAVRKGEVVVEVLDSRANPIAGQEVILKQVSSDFLFGANTFMLDAYSLARSRQRYEDRFLELFNAGTVPLYWRDLEPAPGHLRFTKDSAHIPRRPPPDVVVEWGLANGLNLNGHPLVWDLVKWSVPEWVTDEQSRDGGVWEERVRRIADRYGESIARWDVVNEVCTPWRLAAGESRPMPADYERQAFAWAEAALPADAFLMINEVSEVSWSEDRGVYINLVERLLRDGARVNGIGLQHHLFEDAQMYRVAAGALSTPATLYRTLDDFARLRRPLHVSEITMTSPRDDVGGRDLQARIARDFYRLWFSHPSVDSITWWNFADGGAAPGEDGVDSGLLDRHLNPKPAYEALTELITREWRTELRTSTNAEGRLSFRGFFGRYRLQVAGSDIGEFQLSPSHSSISVEASKR
jgi:GH35 family endo-1,4-beta-xylanase